MRKNTQLLCMICINFDSHSNILDDDLRFQIQPLEGVPQEGDVVGRDHDLSAASNPGGDPEVVAWDVHEGCQPLKVLMPQVPGLKDLVSVTFLHFICIVPMLAAS
jgi:hypothetical protein